MEKKDIILVTPGVLAFIFSIVTFIWTFRQHAIEDRRNTRKSLTDVVAELTKGHLEQCRFSPRDWLPVRIDSYFRV